MDITTTLEKCVNTLNNITISGFDNMDRMVGVMVALKEAIPSIESLYKKIDELQAQNIELTKVDGKEENDG